ncbi:hypothetical protein D3C72_1037380 [compost metagenome]
MLSDRKRKRSHGTQTVFTQMFVIADQPAGDFAQASACLDQILDEVVIGQRLVGEPAAESGHRDDAGFCSVDEVRHHALGTILAPGDGGRAPCGGIGNGRIHPASNRFSQAQSISRIQRRGRGEMLVPGGRVRKQLLAALDVIRKPAAGQHHALAHPNVHG